MRSQRAFTLVELLFVVVVVGALLAVQAVAVASGRDQSSVRSDIADLRLIAQASAIYSDTYDDRLFTFSWRPGVLPDTPNIGLAIACASLDPSNEDHVLRASVLQQLDLVTRNSDFQQIAPVSTTAPLNHAPFVYYNNLILTHFMGESVPSDIFISKGDAARMDWFKNTDAYLDDPASAAFSPPTTATEFQELWRWPFSSSYMTGPSHYSPDTGTITGNPVPRTARRVANNRSWQMPRVDGLLGTRTTAHVASPSHKVQMFDEYDRYSGPFGKYFGLQDARAIQVFYDGSAGRFATSKSDFGFDPNQPLWGASEPDNPTASYTYRPFVGWDPPDAFQIQVPVRYDQTRDGLQGIDFQRGSVRRPIRSR
ncbi:MAG: prepilin-type N-terminal cleavage/methylation domain-containing protein [Phycisphaera sp.]|nr:MAG: prepilin-type N-terminal cleavage/methylation domain-containing protein [Phycisphaera sp.]